MKKMKNELCALPDEDDALKDAADVSAPLAVVVPHAALVQEQQRDRHVCEVHLHPKVRQVLGPVS